MTPASCAETALIPISKSGDRKDQENKFYLVEMSGKINSYKRKLKKLTMLARLM